eukprot:TCONS_00022855-protein
MLVTFILILSLGLLHGKECPVRFERKGCIKTNRVVYHTQIANNRDSNSAVFTGKQVNWSNYKDSLQELACECAKRALQHGVAFALGSFAECWIATNEKNFNMSLANPWQKSDRCIGHDFKKCDSTHKLCIGGIGTQYVYHIGDQTVDGEWGSWNSFTKCSKSCGRGFQIRSRSCTNPPPKNGGKGCQGPATKSQVCNVNACPINGKWGNWTSFGACSKSCGRGFQIRSRSCNNPPPKDGGKDCVGPASDNRACNAQNCPVDGKWGNWTSFGPCTKSCEGGFKIRSRACNNPPPKYGGKDCVGDSVQNRTCNVQNCPVDGKWGNWTSFGSCSKSCGGGFQIRSRACNNPIPKYGGKDCQGMFKENRTCNTQNCPVNGGWGTWSLYGLCNKNCGGGTQQRSRTCNNPAPKYGGIKCPGVATDNRACNTQSCWSSYYEVNLCNGNSKMIKCPKVTQLIRLADYFYGRQSSTVCSTSGSSGWWHGDNVRCRGGQTAIRNSCEGKNSCSISATDTVMGGYPCRTGQNTFRTKPYAYVKYRCYG